MELAIALVALGACAAAAVKLWVLDRTAPSPHDRWRRALGRTRVQDAATAADGAVVKLRGTVHAVDAPLVAPLTGRACVYYKVTLFEYAAEPRAAPREFVAGMPVYDVTMDTTRVEAGTTCWLADATGRARVRLEGATVLAGVVTTLRREPLVPAPPALARFLATLDRRVVADTLECVELIVPVGHAAEARGVARWGADAAGAARGGLRDVARELALEAAGEDGLLVAADPRG